MIKDLPLNTANVKDPPDLIARRWSWITKDDPDHVKFSIFVENDSDFSERFERMKKRPDILSLVVAYEYTIETGRIGRLDTFDCQKEKENETASC